MRPGDSLSPLTMLPVPGPNSGQTGQLKIAWEYQHLLALPEGMKDTLSSTSLTQTMQQPMMLRLTTDKAAEISPWRCNQEELDSKSAQHVVKAHLGPIKHRVPWLTGLQIAYTLSPGKSATVSHGRQHHHGSHLCNQHTHSWLMRGLTGQGPSMHNGLARSTAGQTLSMHSSCLVAD